MGMDLVRIVLEFDAPIVLNNELTVAQFPFALDWVRGADLMIDTFKERVVFNSTNKEHNGMEVLAVNANLFIIRPMQTRDKKLQVVYASSHFIFPRRYIVELGNDVNSTFFTVYSRQSEKIAFNLGIKVSANPSVFLENNKIILRDKFVSFIYDPVSNKVTEHRVLYDTGTPMPFLFLQHLKNGDVVQAKKMLGFNIKNDQLKKYFGKFEILLNNYLGEEDVFSIKTAEGVKSLRFRLNGDVIENIE